MSIIEKVINKLKPSVKSVPRSKPPVAGINQAVPAEFEHQYGAQTDGATSALPLGEAADPEKKTSRQVNLDLAHLHERGIITRYDEKSQIAEEFRIIKRPLIQNSFNRSEGHNKNCNLIMVTSALSGEGKTFCAINLAMSIAMEQDHTVLLIDADVARPSLLHILGIRPDKGLMDVLLDDNIDLSDVILRTNIEKLSILPAGRRSKRATELLASQDMSELLTHISRRYHDRVVIFDSPPLLLTTESRVLATEMGQIVMVVEAETTPQKRVLEALEQIESCSDIKLIYNKSQPFNSSTYFDYYD
ncbi:MAG: XrtA-associated tyrosine autokinase [Gallionella sp.]|nr:XrtA-associated tyrosine autokinase [Gallionella sp.]MDD4946935.1 XrtA-associated tyrosine autokinase [Gallionella sp.]MDD5611573.1 XrtA-associated tyrosine autokinase [Gallionella sp.]